MDEESGWHCSGKLFRQIVQANCSGKLYSSMGPGVGENDQAVAVNNGFDQLAVQPVKEPELAASDWC